jgi:hypothetical protein
LAVRGTALRGGASFTSDTIETADREREESSSYILHASALCIRSAVAHAQYRVNVEYRLIV